MMFKAVDADSATKAKEVLAEFRTDRRRCYKRHAGRPA